MVKVLAAVADVERNLILERTQGGQARARAEGKHMGPPSKTSADDRRVIVDRLEAGEPVTSVARAFKVSRGTVINIRAAVAACI